MLEQRWTLLGLDQCVHGLYETEALAQSALDNLDFNLGWEVAPILVNTTPPDARTEELIEELNEAWEESGTVNLHLSKGIKFYEQPINERYQLLIDMVKRQGVFDPKNAEPISDINV